MRSVVFILCLLATLWVAPVVHAQDETEAGPPVLPDPEFPVVIKASFEGLVSKDPQGVLRALGVTVGRRWPDPMAYRQGVARVFKIYGIILLQPRFTTVPGGTEVVLPVHELPVDLEPRFVGNAEIPEDKLREWALLFDREQIYAHEAERVRTRLMAGYKRQGFHFIEVDVVKRVGGADGQEAAGAAADVIFQIREGPKVYVTGVHVRGNDSLPDTGWGMWRGGLRSLAGMQTKGRGLLRWWGTKFDLEQLRADMIDMSKVYRDRGWMDARVEVERLDISDDRSGVVIHVVVDEGPLYRVRSVKLEAVERDWGGNRRGWVNERAAELLFPEEDLRALLEMHPGTPVETARIRHDQLEIGRYYGERGYIPQEYFQDRSAGGWDWLEPVYVFDTEEHTVDLIYRFAQGRQRSVREVLFDGNAHTRDRVLRRELSPLVGKRANIREIERGLARIRGTGYFSDQLDITHPDPDVILRVAEDDPEKIDVIYKVEEGRVVNLNLSGGVTSDSGILGLISLSMRNFELGRTGTGFWSSFGEIYRKEAFHGNGETLLLDLAPGSEISYYKLFYSHPDLFGSHYNRWTASGQFEDRLRRYQSHDERRKSIELTTGHLFNQGDFSLSLGPRYMEVEIDDIDPDDAVPGILERSEGKSDFVGLDFTLKYSKLDNRMSPREGVFMSWSNTVYGGPFGGDNEVWKTQYQFDWYGQLGAEAADIRSGVYLGGEIGVYSPFGDTDEVNYAERKFYGGASSLRGFDFRGVGPNEGDYSVGGETFLRLSAEYRYPLYTTPIPGTSRRSEMLRGFLFLDAGVLDEDSGTLDLEEHRAAVGFGIALTNPIPLKFNFGFPIREGDGDDTEVFSFRLDFR